MHKTTSTQADALMDTLSTREAAALLGASMRSMQLWVEQGVLTAWKTPGGHRRILRSSVQDMLSKRANTCSLQSTHQIHVDVTGADLTMLDSMVSQGYAKDHAACYRRAVKEAHSKLAKPTTI